MSSTAVEELLQMQKEVDKAKADYAKCEGAIESLMKRLEEFGLDSVESAEEEIATLKQKREELEKRLGTMVFRIKKEFFDES